MRSFCLLASMELILIPNCSLLYLHSNDMNSLKSSLLGGGGGGGGGSYSYNCYSYNKPQIKSVFHQ